MSDLTPTQLAMITEYVQQIATLQQQVADLTAKLAAAEKQVNEYAWLCGKAQDDREVMRQQVAAAQSEDTWLREGWVNGWLSYWDTYSEEPRFAQWIDSKPVTLD